MNRRWLIKRPNPEYVDYISRAAGIPPVLSRILVNRGLRTTDDIHTFLNAGISNMSDPLELPDIAPAISRIKAALSAGEKVLISGDYDADGLTATAIMTYALRIAGLDVHYFIPHRALHGYGFNLPSVETARDIGASLIITVDCGISSFEAAAYAKQLGIDVIITDHHEPTVNTEGRADGDKNSVIPDAIAVINPKISGSSSGISNLSGAGIAFKVVQALASENGLRLDIDDCLSLLDLAALGTAADVVPLTGENRIILKEGLLRINNAARPGIKSLREVSGLNSREVRAGLLSFTLVPRLNAPGRIGDASDVVRLLLSGSDSEASAIAEKIDKANTERQKIENDIYREALTRLTAKGYDSVIVLYSEGWHIGVLGIVAAKLAEEFCRPAFVFAIKDNIAKGSARSIPSFDVHSGLYKCKDLLLSFGGHKQAAGIKLRASDLSEFEKRINEIAKAAISDEDLVSTLEIDAQAALTEIDARLVNEISRLAPFGAGNPEPLLGSKKLNILYPKIVGSNHLKMRLQQKSFALDAIGFDMGGSLDSIDVSGPVDAAFRATINEWNGSQNLQLSLKALRASLKTPA